MEWFVLPVIRIQQFEGTGNWGQSALGSVN